MSEVRAQGLGGAGQREAGASPHTLRIFDYIGEHPGATREEVRAAALDGEWVARGYAHRYYANELSRMRSANGSKSSAAVSVATVAHDRSDDAVRAVVARVLATMGRDGTLRRENDRYYAVRRPQATAQVTASVRPRDEVAAGIALNEARRSLLAYGIDNLRKPAARVPLAVRLQLARWLEASQLVEAPTPDDRPSPGG